MAKLNKFEVPKNEIKILDLNCEINEEIINKRIQKSSEELERIKNSLNSSVCQEIQKLFYEISKMYN